jgi:hypothetical protein
MTVCRRCGVELEDGITICPLCQTSVFADKNESPIVQTELYEHHPIPEEKKHLLQRILWQVTSILLLSGIIATLIIDFAIHKTMTWSVFPVSICLIIFSYASLLAFWHTKTVYQFLTGCFISTLLLMVLNFWLHDNPWIIKLAVPLLLTVNTVAVLLTIIINSIKTKGLNVLAFTFVAIAVLCIAIEAIISFYLENSIHLRWSAIVAACLLPVTAAIVFMYFRTRKNPDLQKIFHT